MVGVAPPCLQVTDVLPIHPFSLLILLLIGTRFWMLMGRLENITAPLMLRQ